MKNIFTILALAASYAVFGAEIYVSPAGSNANAGTKDSPLKSVQQAVNKAKQTSVADGITHIRNIPLPFCIHIHKLRHI